MTTKGQMKPTSWQGKVKLVNSVPGHDLHISQRTIERVRKQLGNATDATLCASHGLRQTAGPQHGQACPGQAWAWVDIVDAQLTSAANQTLIIRVPALVSRSYAFILLMSC